MRGRRRSHPANGPASASTAGLWGVGLRRCRDLLLDDTSRILVHGEARAPVNESPIDPACFARSIAPVFPRRPPRRRITATTSTDRRSRMTREAQAPSEWKPVATQADADLLMRSFGDFHDSCIRETHLWTDHWVAPNLAMACSERLDNRIRFLIQRQFARPSAVELLFEEVLRFNLVPAPENYFSIIFSAKLLVQGEVIFWSPNRNWKPDGPDRDDSTWISARKLRWREVPWLGEALRYGPTE
jgi:hypothetical protein